MSERRSARRAARAKHQTHRAAELLLRAVERARQLERRNEFWRNLLCSTAFASGLGAERLMTEVVEEVHPELLRGAS